MNLRLAVRNGVAMHLRSSWISLEYEAYRNLYYLQQSWKYQGPQKPCDIIGASYHGDCGGICYISTPSSLSRRLWYPNTIFFDDHFEKIGIYRLGFQTTDTGCLGIVPCDACPHLPPTSGCLFSHAITFLVSGKYLARYLALKAWLANNRFIRITSFTNTVI